MSTGFPLGLVAYDQPEGAAKTNPYAAEAWIEPWLLKHSEFYRKHLTRDGRRVSKATRRSSEASAMIESRKNSELSEQATMSGGAGDAVPAVQQPVESTQGEESGDRRPSQEEQIKALKQRREKGGWRRSLGWFV